MIVRPLLVAVTLGVGLSVQTTAAGQSLAEVARKTEAARSVTSDRPPAKVYTNQDVPVIAPPPPPPAAANSAEPATTSPPAMPSTPLTSSTAGTQNEAYWRDRMRPLRERLDNARALADNTKRRAEALMRASDQCFAIGIVCEDYTESLRLTDEHKALVTDLAQAEGDVVALEEEARRAGALPGWLRE